MSASSPVCPCIHSFESAWSFLARPVMSAVSACPFVHFRSIHAFAAFMMRPCMAQWPRLPAVPSIALGLSACVFAPCRHHHGLSICALPVRLRLDDFGMRHLIPGHAWLSSSGADSCMALAGPPPSAMHGSALACSHAHALRDTTARRIASMTLRRRCIDVGATADRCTQ